MAIPIYLAMTPAEYSVCRDIPPSVAWMSCHFSLSGPGLSNIPDTLPSGAVLILDDQIPFRGHQSEIIAEQLQDAAHSLHPKAIILDFQRPGNHEVAKLTESLFRALPCPVIASAMYARSEMPVLLPPCPPNRPLYDHIAPYQQHEIWLELSVEGLALEITKDGCCSKGMPYSEEYFPYFDEKLHCHYRIEKKETAAILYLQRSRDDLHNLLMQAEMLGITHAIGLWQELK